MKSKFSGILKWVAPIVIMIIAIIQLADITFPKWIAITLLIVSVILYTFALFVGRKNKSEE